MLGRFIIIFLAVLRAEISLAQENNIAIGSWRVHLPYYNMTTSAVAGSKIYAANGSSIFYFDKDDNSVNVLSKYNGLHDVLVTKLGFNASQDFLMIGYESGNIDLVQGNSIVNVSDIFRANINGSKRINHFYMSNELAYISCDYGVTLYDLKKKEVKESYLTLTPDFSSNAVYGSTLTSDKDSIFLATSKGVMTAKVSQAINLLDYSNWYTYKVSDSIETSDILAVCAYNGMVYAAVKSKGLYYYNGIKWRKMTIPLTGGGNVHTLTVDAGGVLACMDTSIFRITSPYSWTELFHKDNITPNEAYYDSDNTLWVASYSGGLVQVKNGETNYISPNGTFVNKVFKIGYFKNNIVALAGGYNRLGQRTYFGNWHSIFEDNARWTTGISKYPSIPSSLRDFICVTYNTNNSSLYFSCYGEGLIEVQSDGSTNVFTDSNSPIKRSSSSQNSELFVGETTVDRDGYLWVPNRGVNTGVPNIHKISPDGLWSSYVISSSIAKNIVGVTVDDYDNKWLKTSSPTENGIVVFNEKTNLTRTLINSAGQGKLPDSKVNCITKDKKGALYIGTDQGIAVCYDPSTIFTNGVDLVTPIFEGFPILYERNVFAIEVDGGNRKWVGTNDGLWYFNEDLTEVLLYFNTDNSPLLSDYITDVKVHPLSGEVFFATSEGVISYRGTSTEGDENYKEVKVFPNPVKPDFSGTVGISGLATDVAVKITDVSGNLVYETKASGGTAVWNVKDYNGRRAASGVYLIFCSDKDGSSKFVSKIAVIE